MKKLKQFIKAFLEIFFPPKRPCQKHYYQNTDFDNCPECGFSGRFEPAIK